MRWSANLAYAIGLIASDGCLYKDNRHLDFTSKDLDQVETFKRILKLHTRISLKSSGSPEKKYYHVQFSDVKFYKFLLRIGLTPNKSKTIRELEIPLRYFRDFLRGSFDGDGCTYSYWDPRWKSSFMLYTAFASASKSHLIWIQETVMQLWNIKGRITFHGKSWYQLRYAKNTSLILLEKMYYKADIPYLNRKRFKINQALAIIQR